MGICYIQFAKFDDENEKKSEIQLFNREKMLTIFGWNFEIEERCKGVHCVDLGESFPTSIYLQKSASIQPRTSLSKFEGKFNSLLIRLLSHFGQLLGRIDLCILSTVAPYVPSILSFLGAWWVISVVVRSSMGNPASPAFSTRRSMSMLSKKLLYIP